MTELQQQQHLEQAQRVARIETLCEDMHARLFGNGRPGALDELDTRLSSLEHTEAKAKGALWVLSGLVTALSGGMLTHIFRGGK